MRGKGFLGALLSVSVFGSVFAGVSGNDASAADTWYANTTGTPVYHETGRQLERLGRGVIASYTAVANKSAQRGVYLSWRLLGDESLDNQAFDIYRSDSENGEYEKIYTTGAHDATNYIDTDGTGSNYYKVVKTGASAETVAAETAVAPMTNHTVRDSNVSNGYSEINSYTYVDIPISRPDPVARMGDGKTSYYYSYDSDHEGGANDASVGDLDGDGEYEIVLKWDPTDSKDSAGADYTGNVYIDAYEIDTGNTGYKWRIDLGQNVTAGAHYTQFIVYDFDGDGKSEVAMQTAPGSKDGKGNYVTAVGDTEEIRSIDNTKSYIGTSGDGKGKNSSGYEFYTVFDGETGEALCTTEAIPIGESGDWGDSTYNRCMRFLAGVAYLDGVHPSLIECRGYYTKVVIRAYSFEDNSLTMQWEYTGSSKGASSLYGQGFHNLNIADIDNDGYDEIVYGSACLDHDGKTVLGNTQYGHGDAQHTSDFNNDGVQESFVVHEDSEGYKEAAGQFKVTATGETLWATTATGDTGRGVMDNIDDSYASSHSDALALGWESSNAYTYDFNGDQVAAKPATSSRTMTNFLVYWDGDLGRELLDDNQLTKYYAATGTTKRFYFDNTGSFEGSANNYSKNTPSLCADIWGDWREEIVVPINKDSSTEQAYLRIYTSTIPTEYRLATLMHDSQYRCAVAWQNVGYNQPPHTSYYIGSVALAKSGGETMNYLAPATLFTRVDYGSGSIAPQSVSLSPQELVLEKGSSGSITVITEPDNASKSFEWTSSETSVVTVAGGTATAVGTGTAKITAVSKLDPAVSASCTVTVWETPVTGIAIDNTAVTGVGLSKQLNATVLPANASDKSIVWTSSDETVVTVDSSGKIIGKSEGAAVITAASSDGIHKAACNVSVNSVAEHDVTGDGIWITDNTDNESVLSPNTAAAATMTQTNAETGANFYRDMETLTENKAKLTLHFTTGGKKLVGENWNWTGHEYTLNLAFLAENGENLLTLSQPYAESAGTLMTKLGGSDSAAFSTVWTELESGIGNIQGSAKRWILEIEFDYDNDLANAVITAADSSWNAVNGCYSLTFDLGGSSLGRIECYTEKDGAGGITCQPMIESLSYVKTAPEDGAHSVVYERGTNENTAWSPSDLYASNLTTENSQTAELLYSADAAAFGRIYYNPTQPGTSYSSTLDFDIDEAASVITYDVDWYFSLSTANPENYEYIQIGDHIKLGWNSCYKVYISTTGDNNWDDQDGDGESDVLFEGTNRQPYVKHIQVVFDKTENKIKSLTFDGEVIEAYNEYQLPDDKMDSIKLGFYRVKSTGDWEIPTGLDSVKVSQYVPLGTVPDPQEAGISLLAADDFEDNGSDWIVRMTKTDQVYTGIDGITLYVGSRSDGDNSLGFKYANDIEQGGVIAMESGNFSNANRGPRFTFSKPDVFENDTIYTASIKVKPVSENAVLYCGDSTSQQAENNLNLAAGEWSEITVTIAMLGGTAQRTIYVNGNAVYSDNVAGYPVFWGNGIKGSYAEVYLDELLLTSQAVEHASVNGYDSYPVYVSAQTFYGEYTNEDGTVTQNPEDYASLADQIKIKAGDLAVTGLEVYIDRNKTGSTEESETGFTTISAGAEAVIAVIIEGAATDYIGISAIE